MISLGNNLELNYVTNSKLESEFMLDATTPRFPFHILAVMGLEAYL